MREDERDGGGRGQRCKCARKETDEIKLRARDREEERRGEENELSVTCDAMNTMTYRQGKAPLHEEKKTKEETVCFMRCILVA